MIITEGLTFDDVLLMPNYSEILPSEVSCATSIGGNLELKIPILSAAMNTVTEEKMAIAMVNSGGLGVIHKNMSISQQVKMVQNVLIQGGMVAAAIGVDDAAAERAAKLLEAGVSLLVLDTAHGHSKLVLDGVRALKNQYKCLVMAGNVATADGAKALADVGADIVKVGIGPGSICTTRIVAGVGVPQLTAIMNVFQALIGYNVKIVADGGIRYSGDIVKALAAGANAVMLGSLLAGTEESPGEVLMQNGIKVKSYIGMGSIKAATSGSDDRYMQHKRKGKFIAEGIESFVEAKGSVVEVLEQMVGGLCLGMGYNGAANILELQKKARFVKITNAGLDESHPHSLKSIFSAPNYKT